MSYDYDALYSTEKHALGAPTKAIVDFFATYARQAARVLDVGCGQGRDALFIARLGHRVVAVDLSPAGVADVRRDAEAEGLPVTGVVADIRDFVPDGEFDVLLIDRTLHMLDAGPRVAVLARLLGHLAPEGWLLLADEASNMPAFRAVLARSGRACRVVRDAKGLLFAQVD